VRRGDSGYQSMDATGVDHKVLAPHCAVGLIRVSKGPRILKIALKASGSLQGDDTVCVINKDTSMSIL